MEICKKHFARLLLALTLSVALSGTLAFADGQGEGKAKKLSQAKPDFGSLKGRWMRPEGGYVVSIDKVEPSGKMEAAYYNPRPINVSKAEATLENSTIKVFFELRGANYPGSTYTLTYDSENDTLKGVYYQAALQQSFDVVFLRIK